MVIVVHEKIKRETEIEFITHMSWKKYTACLKGPHGEVTAGCRQRGRIWGTRLY